MVWLHARLSPEGYLGLHLTVGALVLVAAAWAFGSVAEDVIEKDPLVVLDQNVANWFHRHATPALVRVMMVLSFFGSGVWIAAAAAFLALYLVRQHGWYRLVTLVLVTPGGAVLNVLLKLAFHRNRPLFDDPIQTLKSYSFPSGHTMAATLFYGLLAVFAVFYLRSWRWRVAAVLLACVLIALIGLSRIALGVHYLSDVLAASAAGLAWLTVCVTAVETLRRRSAHKGNLARATHV